jgi:hypothetical protein
MSFFSFLFYKIREQEGRTDLAGGVPVGGGKWQVKRVGG